MTKVAKDIVFSTKAQRTPSNGILSVFPQWIVWEHLILLFYSNIYEYELVVMFSFS